MINGDNEGVIESTDKFLVKHKLLEVHNFYEGLRNCLIKLQLLTFTKCYEGSVLQTSIGLTFIAKAHKFKIIIENRVSTFLFAGCRILEIRIPEKCVYF